jgi:large subunit ribosomal protein L29
MKYEEVSGLPKSELHKKKKQIAQDLLEARMKNTMGQLANPLSIRTMRRDIARLNTAMRATSKNVKATAKATVKAKVKAKPKAKG